MSRGQTPTTTSYATLGLLAVQPWSTYELTNQIRRSLARFWPRASSKLYEEPRKLVALGYASAETHYQGRRRRTVYSITPEGRHALGAWLGTTSAPPAMESEQLLRVFLADQGTRDDLLATIAATRAWAREQAVLDAAIAREHLAGGPFPERLAVNTLVGRYLSEVSEATERWADWASEVVGAWPEEMTELPVDADALQLIADRDPGGRG
ncbi:PadR family transcriptional regulator [Pseudonocardia parietis]|uniref:DNA-binding PadR family transcriptional regulator n=1 Tax=Pseudonocardia parietis TaxID=570936 RepID=A0ABS4VVQ9_9PSEU|nr:PadR family transcriptional regulator [Pseudonocardia parietis]MBP2368010.1 DNA-binding PadR family transcriptional regulator [Pseudonocardia parietis]